MKHEIRVERFQHDKYWLPNGNSDEHRYRGMPFYHVQAPLNTAEPFPFLSLPAERQHVAWCPACKNEYRWAGGVYRVTYGRARGLTEFECRWLWLNNIKNPSQELKDHRNYQQILRIVHNALFNSPADGDVEVTGI